MSVSENNSLMQIESMLTQRIGLDLTSLEAGAAAQAAGQRMAALKIEDRGAYALRLLADEEEFGELVEQLIVPETWFFRDVRPFECLRQFAAGRLAADTGPIRALSVPCCTGEETWSIAMTLLDAGFPSGRFHVDGVDISRRVLGRAEEGAYCRRSFREQAPSLALLQDRYFTRSGEWRMVTDEVRSSVRFFHGNLSDFNFLAGQAPYHVVFCRNLLIYLNSPARQRVLDNLKRLVASHGILYVGHAEAAAVRSADFQVWSDEFPFAFRPVAATEDADRSDWAARPDGPVRAPRRRAPAERTRRKTPERGTMNRRSLVRGAPKEASRKATPASASEAPKKTPGCAAAADGALCSLDAARRAADGGRLDQAEALCADMLVTCPPCPDLYCLLGVIQLARDRPAEAERSFEKALYLDPRHRESLVHMMLICQQAGRRNLAENYRRRVERTSAGRN